jgi:ABC-type transporter lipoprotein component MlaA
MKLTPTEKTAIAGRWFREALKEAALDPYMMIRNAYVQNHNKLIVQ